MGEELKARGTLHARADVQAAEMQILKKRRKTLRKYGTRARLTVEGI